MHQLTPNGIQCLHAKHDVFTGITVVTCERTAPTWQKNIIKIHQKKRRHIDGVRNKRMFACSTRAKRQNKEETSMKCEHIEYRMYHSFRAGDVFPRKVGWSFSFLHIFQPVFAVVLCSALDKMFPITAYQDGFTILCIASPHSTCVCISLPGSPMTISVLYSF